MTNNSDAMQLPLATLVVIDAQVDDYEVLLNGVVDGASTLLLDSRRDGVEQITEALAGSATPISSLHIVSHGSPGTLYLGSTQLSLDTLAHYAPQLSRWFENALPTSPHSRVPASSSTPSLLLYGCNVAAGDAGEELLNKLHRLTGACISASSNKTGHPSLNADWNLEKSVGGDDLVAKSALVFSAVTQQAYLGTFAPPTNDNFADRIILTGSNVSTTGTNVEATTETGEGGSGSPQTTVWWEWTAPSSGSFQIDTNGSSFDTQLVIFTGSDLATLSEVDYDDDGGDGLDSLITLNTVAGTTYQIRVDGLSSAAGDISLNIAQLSVTDSDGGLIAGTTISEPVALPAESETLAEAVSLFDFAITDGGSSDGLDLTVTEVRVSTAGSTGDPSQVTWLLSGPDLGTDVVGSYSGGVITFDVSGTPITVADGNTAGEAYTVKAYVDGTVNSGETFNLSIDGDTDLTVDGAGTQIGTTDPVNNGSGSVVTVIPLVQSITLNDPNPTNANTLNFTVTFNQAVTGVDVSDFSINAAIGIVGEAVSTVSGSGTTYIVTVATGTGEGNLRLDVVDNDSIISQSTGVKLGGSGLGNGNFNSGPSYNIDRTAPSKPSNLDLANDGTSDSGVQDDKITNNSQPSITGTAAANATIEIRDSLGNLIGTGSTGGSSTFNVPLTAPLTEGSNTLSVTVTDAAGNESAVTQVTITLDTTAPNAPGAIALTTATDSGVDGDSITNNTTPSLTGTAEANSTVTIRDASDQVVGTGVTSGTGTWTVSLTSELTSGDNTLFVTATDAAGNTTVTPAQTVVTIDTVAEPVIANLDATSDSGEFDNDGITSDTTPTISGTAEANSTIEIVVPDGFGGETILGTGTADGSGNWSVELSPAFSEDGTYAVGVRATDVAGNVATTTAGFVIDTTAPSLPTVGTLITNNNTPTLSGTFVEGNALEVTVNEVTYTLDASQELSNNGGIWALNLGGLATPLADGTYDVSVTTTDLAGNSSSDESLGELTVDTLPPAAPTVDGLVTQDSTPILTGSYTPGDILTIVVGGNTYTLGDSVIADSPELTADQAGNWTLDLSAITPLADNTYDVTATAEDAAGNTSTDGTSGELVVDTTAPDAPTADLSDLDNSNSGSVDDLITNVAQPTLSGTAEANSTVTITYGETSQEIFTANGDWEITLNTALTEGDNLISVTATDEAGNESTATDLTVTLDTLIDIPTVGLAEGSDTGVAGDNITNTATPVLTGSTEPGATVKIYADAVLEANLLGTTTADETGAWTFDANLPEGSNTLLVTATDLADNTSQPANLTVDVDLTLPTAPTINTVGDNTGFPTLTGTFTEGDDLTVAIAGTGLSFSLDDPELSSDGAGNWTLNLSNLAEPVNTGTYNVIATATDVAGNNSADVSTGELTIDITPPTAPTVNSLLTQSNQPIITGTFDPNDFTSFTVEIVGVDTYTLGIDGILSVNGNTWELDLTGVAQLSDGTYEVIATATDEAGNASTDESSGELIVDTMAPGLPTINLAASSDSGIQGDDITNDTTPTLEGSAEANSEVFISGGGINTSVFADGDGVWSFTPTVDVVGSGGGDVTFTAIAVDAAGNASSPANLTINVDLTAPAAPLGLDLLTADDSGSSNSDDLTKDNTPRISGTAEAGTTVELFDGETSLGTAIADQSGLWTITSAALVGSNSGISYNLTATATDSVGNESVLSTPLTVVIDTGIDKPSTPAIAEEDDTGLSASDNVTNNNQPRFTGVAEPGSTVTVRSNRNGVLGTVVADAQTGEWTLEGYQAVLISATHSITVQATDLAGNTSTVSNALTLTVDTAPPSAPSVPNLTPTTDSGRSTTDNVTNNVEAQFSGTAASNTLVTLFSDIDGELGSVNTQNFSWSFTVGQGGEGFPLGLSEGVHNITAIATDLAGNESSLTNPLQVKVDLTVEAPAILAIASDTGDAGDDGITSDRTLAISGTAEPSSTVQVLLDGQAIGTASVNGSGNWTFNYSTPLVDGDYVLSAVTTDVAGNVSDPSEPFLVTIDGTKPVAPVVVGVFEDTGFDPTDGITSSQNLILNGTAEAEATITLFQDGALIGETAADSNGDWSFNYTGTTLTPGSYGFTARAQDVAGNLSDPSVTFDVLVDTGTVDPTVAAISEDTGESDSDFLTSDNTPLFSGTAEAGAEVTLTATSFEGAFVLGTATADENGDWQLQVDAALNDNEYSITAEAVDVAGNTATVLDIRTVVIDSTEPVAPSQPFLEVADDSGFLDFDGITRINTPTLGGNAEPDTLIQLFDGATLIGETTTDEFGSWTYTVPENSALSDGDYLITAVSTDGSGNVSQASSALAITIDTGAPAAPTALRIVAENDTGTSNNDGITNNVSPVISGTAEVGTLVELFFQGGARIGEAFVGEDGTWQIPVEPPVDDGNYQLVATATDTAGNTSEVSTTLNISVDTNVSPGVTLALSAESDPEGDDLISTAQPTFEGTVEPGSTVFISSNLDGELGSAIADEQGNWSFTPDTNLSDGNHVITAFAVDVAGNEIGDFIEFEVDTVPPEAPSTPDLVASSDTGDSDTDNITSNNLPVFTGTAEIGSSVDVFTTLAGQEILLGSVQADGSGVWSFDAAAAAISPLADGDHVVTAVVRDTAGNTASSQGLNLTIDTIAPSIPTNLLLDEASDTGARDNITSDGTPTITGTADAGSLVTLFNESTELGSTTADQNGDWSITVATSLPDGAYDLTAVASDQAGNSSNPSTVLAVTIDSTPPPAPSIPDLAPESDSGVDNDDITNVTTPTFVGTAEADAEIELFVVGLGSVGSTTVDSNGDWTFTLSTGLADGTYDIFSEVTGVTGLTTTSEALTFTVDGTPPAAPAIAGLQADSGSAVDGDGLINDSTLIFSGTSAGADSVELFLNGNSIGNATVDGSGNWSLDYTSTSLEDGSYTLTAISSDLAGNTTPGAAPFDFEIDTVAPTVTGVTASTGDGTFGQGSTVSLVVNFSESVLVTGSPKLGIELARSSPNVDFSSGSGTNALSFNYLVGPDDANRDLNYTSTDALTLGTGVTIQDAAGNVAVLTLPEVGAENSLSFNQDIRVQGTPSPALGETANNYLGYNFYVPYINASTTNSNISYTPVEVGNISLEFLFDETYYLSQNPDIAEAVFFGTFDSGWDHFTQYGVSEGRSPSVLYNEQFYLANNPDIASAVSTDRYNSGLEHFLQYGHKENRQGSALFDVNAYRSANPDVVNAVSQGRFSSVFEHFVERGANEGRQPNLTLFSESIYLAINTDVAAAVEAGRFESGFDHYINFGQKEERTASFAFNEASYLANNPDVNTVVQQGRFPSGFFHYIEYGRAEGRTV